MPLLGSAYHEKGRFSRREKPGRAQLHLRSQMVEKVKYDAVTPPRLT